MSSFLPDVLVANAMQKLGVKSNIDPLTLQEASAGGTRPPLHLSARDGGWGWWQTDDSHPFMTAYVLAGLSQAKAAGFDVKQDAIDHGRGWLKPYFDHSQKVKTDLRAYMAYALVLSGAHETRCSIPSGTSARLSPPTAGAARAGHAGGKRSLAPRN